MLTVCTSEPVRLSPAEPPRPEPLPPAVSLVFDGIETTDPAQLNLGFSLRVENPLPFAVTARLDSWRAEVNGQRAGSGFSLVQAADMGFSVPAGAASFPLRLTMDMAALAAQGLAPADDYAVMLTVALGFSRDGEARLDMEVSALAAFPGIQAPVFSITSIAILQADLVNTRFRVGLKIDNPNVFPVELSALNYRLYGNGIFWANGTERNIIAVAGKSTLQGDLFLTMNFIDMNRNLLDQIIRLEDVNYRFAGNAQVITGIDYLPRFDTSFDLSGYSQVLER